MSGANGSVLSPSTLTVGLNDWNEGDVGALKIDVVALVLGGFLVVAKSASPKLKLGIGRKSKLCVGFSTSVPNENCEIGRLLLS